MLPYIPSKLPYNDLDWHKLIPYISKANSLLSQYNGLLEGMVNPHILLSPITTKEATLSSKIEGTQATLSEVLLYEAGDEYKQEKVLDIEEIINYRRALISAEELLKNRPFIHLNMIKKLHFILLSGVRGANKRRGEFRLEQNWIGPIGCNIEDAKYVPPSPTDMMDALNNWEQYINSEEVDILLQLAFLHAQFEIIHPFLDGNGRIGRILIPVFLYAKNYLKSPVFYLSEYLENNRDEYYEKLNNITSKGDWQSWIEFFLDAIIKQSEVNIKKAKEVLFFYSMMKLKFQEITKSQYSAAALDAIFVRPVINSTDFDRFAHINSKRTSSRILQKLENEGILKLHKASVGSAPATYIFPELLNITEGKEIF